MERWFAGPTEKRIRRGVFRSARRLEQAALHHIQVDSRDPKPFAWTETAAEIFETLGRLCHRIPGTGH
jgi:putative transposase